MTEKRFTIGDRTLQEVYECCIPAILDGGIPCTQSQVLKLLNELNEENKQLKQYKKALWDWDSSKIIRVNMNTGEVDLVDKELKE